MSEDFKHYSNMAKIAFQNNQSVKNGAALQKGHGENVMKLNVAGKYDSH